MYRDYLECLYNSTPIPEHTAVRGEGFSIYGELLFESTKRLLKEMAPSKDDVFLDLGSGLGKVAFPIFLMSDCKSVFGIEQSRLRQRYSADCLSTLRRDLPDFFLPNRKLDFYLGDFLQYDIPDATIVYTCSTCFSEKLLDGISEKLNNCFSVQKVFSLRPLDKFTRLPFKKAFPVEASWDTSLCYVYAE